MKKLKFLSFPLISTTYLLSSGLAFAQDSLGQYFIPGSKLTSGNTTLSDYLAPVIQNFPLVTGLGAFLTAILAGLKYISSADNEKEIKAATNMLTYALIGLVLSVAAIVVTRLLFQIGGGKGLF